MEFTSSKQYEILGKPIGSGGFGCVFRIRSKTDDKVYALKTVDLDKLKSPGASEDQVERLATMAKREAKIMQKAQPHEHIVKVFGWFTEDSTFHIVMELFGRGTLKQAIQGRNGVIFPEAQITNWAAQLAITLKHLHNNNILHRDVKSENIFITENDLLKLGDFGIAKSLDGSSTVHLAVGTMTHMAPELLDDENSVYDDKAEVWAYGVVLYELMQLELPFPASSNIRKMTNSVCENPIPPIKADLSPELRSLTETKLLDRNPHSRLTMDQVICHPCILNALTNQLATARQPVSPQQAQPSHQVDLPLNEAALAEQKLLLTSSQVTPPPQAKGEDLEAWFDAVKDGNLEQVKQLFRSGANPNQKNERHFNRTALHYCGNIGYHEMAEFLLQNGAIVDERDKHGQTPLMFACQFGHKQVVQLFVSNSASVNAKGNGGRTPLILAAANCREEIVRWLVNDNPQLNINEKDDANNTALQSAFDKMIFWKQNGNIDKAATFDRIIEFLRLKGSATN